MSTPKVFGIGFHKTGTSSLAKALRLLGYSVTGPNGVFDPNIRHHALDLALGLVDQYDAFQDNPWPLLYRELDGRLPGSRFILTVRPSDAWLKSVKGQLGPHSTPMSDWIYGFGNPEGHEATYVERYERHNRDVREYFARRTSDFLELRITEGEGWEKLCPFLGHPIPQSSFPHANAAVVRETPLGRLLEYETLIRDTRLDRSGRPIKPSANSFWILSTMLEEARAGGARPEELKGAEKLLADIAAHSPAGSERSLFRLAVRVFGPRVAGRVRNWWVSGAEPGSRA